LDIFYHSSVLQQTRLSVVQVIEIPFFAGQK
jgi:hypothetical protein